MISIAPAPRVLHIAPPRIRTLPLQSYMKPDRCPVLLRPTCFDDGGGSSSDVAQQQQPQQQPGRSQEQQQQQQQQQQQSLPLLRAARSEREAFVAYVERFAGEDYSVTGAAQLLAQTLVKRHTTFEVRAFVYACVRVVQ